MKLKDAQEAAQRVEERVRLILMGWSPADELRVADIKFIAGLARREAFDAFEMFIEEPASRPASA